MSGFLDAKIAQFLPKNLTNRATISSIFIQKLNDFIYREIPPDLIRASLCQPPKPIMLMKDNGFRFDLNLFFYRNNSV